MSGKRAKALRTQAVVDATHQAEALRDFYRPRSAGEADAGFVRRHYQALKREWSHR